MERRKKIINLVVIPLIIFLFAYSLRGYFFSGFILGDDRQEFGVAKYIIERGPYLDIPLYVRFGVWLFNSIFFKLFGVSETTFFLPTWIMSASLSVIGYYILLEWGYPVIHAFWGGLFIASAPFEVLVGTIRANDLIFSWFLALGFLFFILYEKKPVLQGICLAFFWWLAFYVKLWVVYLFPALLLYYSVQIIRERIGSGLISFSITSLFLHAITIIFWKIKLGMFFPFITYYAATYPVETKDLGYFFMMYPKAIFQGSEFKTTLFGFIPYALLVFVGIKLSLPFFKRTTPTSLRFDRFDLILLIYYGSFFLFLNFFPAAFKFDRYYSVPRIFRYLIPLSFPMTLHLAKLTLDFLKINFVRSEFSKYVIVPVLGLMILTNIYQANDATKPGNIYRKALLGIVKDVKAEAPSQLLAEAWLSSFLIEVYLKAETGKILIVPILNAYHAEDYEKWLKKNQPNFQEGTLLITGLGSYVYYGAHSDGFRLRQFKGNLDPHWKLLKEYGLLTYLPLPEPARLWRLSGKITAPSKSETLPNLPDNKLNDERVNTLFKNGMEHFDKNNYSLARRYFEKIIRDFPNVQKADDALYFYSICYFREGNWKMTVIEFTNLIEKYRESRWEAAAHYHIGVSYKELKDIKQARREFQYVIDYFPSDAILVNLSRQQLKELYDEEGTIQRFFKSLFNYTHA